MILNNIKNYDTDEEKSTQKPRREGQEPGRAFGGKPGVFSLKKSLWPTIIEMVVLGGALAVSCTRNPLYAGLNSLLKGCSRNLGLSLIGRHATDGYEPRQVRKEAAISNAVCVVDRSRSRRWSLFSGNDSTEGAQPLPNPPLWIILPFPGPFR